MAKRIEPGPGTLADLPVPAEAAGSLLAVRGRATVLRRRWAIGVAVSDGIVAAITVLLVSWPPSAALWALAGLAPVVVVLVFTGHGLYRLDRLSPAQEFRKLFGAVSVGVIALGVVVALLSKVPGWSGLRDPSLGIGWIAMTWALLLLLTMVERKGWHRVVARMREDREFALRTLVVGADVGALQLAARLATSGVGYRAVGVVTEEPQAAPEVLVPGSPEIVGSVEELSRAIERTGAECLFIVSSAVAPDTMTEALRVARRAGLEIRISASMPEILVSRLSLQMIGGTLALSLDNARLSGAQAVAKRIFDLVVATLSILITSPLWLLAALAIKVTSRGPVLFRQERVGRLGKAFTIYKFRTMVADAEQRREELLALSSGPLFKLAADPRVTRVGRLLRRWSIDELPQLLNVIRGDMSMVGPRPLVMFDPNEVLDWHLQRLEVPPGITGLWQVSGRSELSFDECVQLDVFYIENWSPTYDLYILLKTIPAVLQRRGAY